MIMVSIVVLSMLTAISVDTLLNTANTADACIGRSTLDLEAHNLLESLMRELIAADVGSISPNPFPNGSGTIHFRCLASIQNSALIWSDERSLILRASSRDPQDGMDNDRDGHIDEVELVLLRNVGELDQSELVLNEHIPRLAPNELANGLDDDGDGLIDEAGFSIAVNDGILVLRLTIQGRDAAQRRISRSVESAVRLRNRQE
jgi:hypothetical protein